MSLPDGRQVIAKDLRDGLTDVHYWFLLPGRFLISFGMTERFLLNQYHRTLFFHNFSIPVYSFYHPDIST